MSNYEKINPDLDKDHEQLIEKLQNIYIHLQQHFLVEENMFNKGLKKIPQNHSGGDTKELQTNIWNEHKKEHEELLNNFKKISRSLLEHINTTDSSHFHWTKD